MPRISKNVETSRLNLEMPVEVRKRLEQLRDATNADSLSEVIRRALGVYAYLLDEQKAGRKLITKGKAKDDEREVVLI